MERAKPILLSGLFLLWAKVLVFARPADQLASGLLVETAELGTLVAQPGVRVIDARLPEEYRQGHVPGAVNLPAPATESLEANRQGFPLPPERAQQLFLAAGIDTDSRIILYDSQGTRFAARLFYVLEFFGRQHVQVLNGGFPKWQAEGRPTTTDTPDVPAGDFVPAPHDEMIATGDWVAKHLNDPGVRIVDARSPAEFSGEQVQGPRGGHIPGAVNIEWTRALAPGHGKPLLPSAELEKLFAAAEIKPEHEVVAYCQSGMRASLVYFALRLVGFPRVRMYDGSWADWSSNVALPIER